MQIDKFMKEFNFHDYRIFNIYYDVKSNTLKFNVENNLKEIYEIIFYEVFNFKCEEDVTKIDDYLLNIWKTKRSKNGVEIIIDNDEYLTVYFNANSVEIKIIN